MPFFLRSFKDQELLYTISDQVLRFCYVTTQRALLRHRPSRPGPRASHIFEYMYMKAAISKVAKKQSTNQHQFLGMHAICGWPRVHRSFCLRVRGGCSPPSRKQVDKNRKGTSKHLICP